MMAKKAQRLATMRGLYRFEEAEFAITMVRAPIEDTSQALVNHVHARRWDRDIYDKPMLVEGSSFWVPFQLDGHGWTTMIDDTRSADAQLAHAKALSASLKTEAIFYTGNDTAGVWICQLYKSGRLVESLENDSGSGSTLEELDALLRAHDALLFYDVGFGLPPFEMVSFSLAPAAARAGRVLRADLIAVDPAREVSSEQLEAERQADRAVEQCNEAFVKATLPPDRYAFGRPPSKKQRAEALARHRELLGTINGFVDRGTHLGDDHLWEAARSGNTELVRILIRAGVDLNVTPSGSTPLEAAIRAGAVETAVALVEAGADPSPPSADTPALHLAAAKGAPMIEVVRALLRRGIKLDVKDSLGQSALDIAKHKEVRRLLIDAGVRGRK
jgi:ankyrin repeat protein